MSDVQVIMVNTAHHQCLNTADYISCHFLFQFPVRALFVSFPLYSWRSVYLHLPAFNLCEVHRVLIYKNTNMPCISIYKGGGA